MEFVIDNDETYKNQILDIIAGLKIGAENKKMKFSINLNKIVNL